MDAKTEALIQSVREIAHDLREACARLRAERKLSRHLRHVARLRVAINERDRAIRWGNAVVTAGHGDAIFLVRPGFPR